MRSLFRLLLLPVAVVGALVGAARGQPALPAVAAALAAHFRAQGLTVEPRAVKVLSKEPKSSFELRFKELPVPVLISVYSTSPAAANAVKTIGDRPSHAYPRRNENLVMVLPFWDESVPQLPKVLEAFASFKHGN